MRKVLKRIFILALVFNLSVMSVSTANIKARTNAPRVHNAAVVELLASLGLSAFELVGLLLVLSVLGFTVQYGVKDAYENRDEYCAYMDNFLNKVRNDFLQWCSESAEWSKVKADDFNQWLRMVASGTLDKTSDCWNALKDYLTDMKGRIDDVNSSSAGNDVNVIKVDGAGDWLKSQFSNGGIAYKSTTVRGTQLQAYQNFENVRINFRGDNYFLSSSCQLVAVHFSDNEVVVVSINPLWTNEMDLDFFKNCPYISGDLNSSRQIFRSSLVQEGVPAFCAQDFLKTSGDVDMFSKDAIVIQVDFPFDWNWYYSSLYVPVFGSFATGVLNGFDDWSIEIPKDDGVTDEVAQGMTVAGGTSGAIERDGNLDNVDVVGVGGAVTDDVVPVDWDKVGSIDDIATPYPDVGTVTWDKVGGVEIETDTPIEDAIDPDKNGGSGSDKTKDNFTLSGLSELFPFCIPFDLVMLYRTLTADAEAPHFTYTFVYYIDGKKKTKDIKIDLSKFNDVAKILRTMELLAFMIFLTIKTRDLIRG